MNNEKILKEAFKKARNNGWSSTVTTENIPLILVTYPMIIFSHDFAKAFWGGDSHNISTGSEGRCWYCGHDSMTNPDRCWKKHLQQLVLETEPLKYLEKFL